MAARQDQGLVFTLITFVILFIIAFVAAYVGWKSYSDAQTQIVSLQEGKRADQAAVNTQTDLAIQMKTMLGVGENDSQEDVAETFKSDMTLYAGTLEPGQQSYRNIIEYLAKENEAISAREASAKEELKGLKDRMLALESENEKKVAQYQGQMKAAEQDAASERAQHNKDRVSLEATKKQLQDNLAQQETRYEQQLAEINGQLKDLTDKLTKSEDAKENLLAEVSKSSESFEVPDGRISWINQDGTVWINLGAADSLRKQITFSVFDADAQDPAKTQQKGSIEVTRILGDHMAEAQITSDDLRNPVLTGDQIYSQVWHRGKSLRFALMGIIDLDGDGLNDMKLARDLIELNGGVVDAYVDDDGTIQGKISVNTRYLVRGDEPTGGNAGALQQGWTDMSNDARVNGVELITLDKFLNQIGYAPDDRVVQLGSGARSSDFPPRAEASGDGASPAPFRRRSPSGSAPASSGRYFRFSP
jgi:hypothetical protein